MQIVFAVEHNSTGIYHKISMNISTNLSLILKNLATENNLKA